MKSRVQNILCALLTLAVVPGVAAQQPNLGFTRRNAERQRTLEAAILGQPSAERMLAYHRPLTAEPITPAPTPTCARRSTSRPGSKSSASIRSS